MKTLFILNNRENEFNGAIYCDDCSDDKQEIFGGFIAEYNWEEDQTLQNAVEILKGVGLYFRQTASSITKIITEKNNIISKKSLNFVNSNVLKKIDFLEDNTIILEESWADEIKNEVDEVLVMSEDLDQGIY